MVVGGGAGTGSTPVLHPEPVPGERGEGSLDVDQDHEVCRGDGSEDWRSSEDDYSDHSDSDDHPRATAAVAVDLETGRPLRRRGKDGKLGGRGRSWRRSAGARRPRIIEYRELRGWRKKTASPYILRGYRVDHTFYDSLLSVFQLHNETMNIWSHLIGLMAWVWMYMRLLSEPWFVEAIVADGVVYSVFTIGYALCAFMPAGSVVYHTFYQSSSWCCFQAAAPSKPLSLGNVCLRVDLLGIYLLLLSRLCVEGYLSFYTYPGYLHTLAVSSALVFSVSIAMSSVAPHKPVTLAPAFVIVHVPAVFFLYTEDWMADSTLYYHAVSTSTGTLIFFVAFFFYLKRWPESLFKPGVFDYIGSSHQLWHFLTWLGPTVILYSFEGLARSRILPANMINVE